MNARIPYSRSWGEFRIPQCVDSAGEAHPLPLPRVARKLFEFVCWALDRYYTLRTSAGFGWLPVPFVPRPTALTEPDVEQTRWLGRVELEPCAGPRLLAYSGVTEFAEIEQIVRAQCTGCVRLARSRIGLRQFEPDSGSVGLGVVLPIGAQCQFRVGAQRGMSRVYGRAVPCSDVM